MEMQTSLVDVPRRNGFSVFYGPHAASEPLLRICAQLSLDRTVRVLDFGNRCNMYRIAQELRWLTTDPVAAMNNIRLSRAFTCYQAAALLEQNASLFQTPILILDLLSVFLDESISGKESERLFYNLLYHISSAQARQNFVIAGVQPLPRVAANRAGMFYQLREAADHFQEFWAEAEIRDIAPLPQPSAGSALQMALW